MDYDTINEVNVENLQAEINGAELFYDKEVGFYTKYTRTADSGDESYPVEVIINVLSDQTTAVMFEHTAKPLEEQKEFGAKFTINHN